MFKKITIIGVGLIGSSLALALKRGKLAEVVIGCSKTEKTLNTALSLNIIDEGTTDIAAAVKGADMVVLCTPIGTYNSIASSVSGALESYAVLTDVGSVKHIPTEHIISALTHEQRFRFVPAHPIAGTEKSGPEAGFATLFKGRKTILSPLPITDQDCIVKVKKMWQSVGAEVDVIDARRHDFIYAAVSHNIQLLSSAFGLSLASLSANVKDNIRKNLDINFSKFIRLIASDPLMWRDIFMENMANIETTVDVLFQNLSSMKESISSHEGGVLSKRLHAAYEKRLYFHDLLKGEERRDFRAPNYGSLAKEEIVWMDIMPRLISCLVMEGLSDNEYQYATGAGLHGFTKNIILEGAVETTDIFMHGKEVMAALSVFTKHVKKLLDLILSEDAPALLTELAAARKTYDDFVG